LPDKPAAQQMNRYSDPKRKSSKFSIQQLLESFIAGTAGKLG